MLVSWKKEGSEVGVGVLQSGGVQHNAHVTAAAAKGRPGQGKLAAAVHMVCGCGESIHEDVL